MKRLILLCLIVPAAAEEFRFPVWRVRLTRDEPGQLVINEERLTYVADKRRTRIDYALLDIHEADVSDPRVIRIQAYDIARRRLGGRQVHTFRLRGVRHDERLARFLADRLKRPVVGAYSVAASAFEIPVFHRHRTGGCHGTLRAGEDGIRFEASKPADSRTWLWRDIDSTGTMGPYHFRVTTHAETYNFDLKDRLPEALPRYVWEQLYGESTTGSQRFGFGGGGAGGLRGGGGYSQDHIRASERVPRREPLRAVVP
jgi:hypothetical protein